MVLGYARSMPVPAEMMFKIGEDSGPAAVLPAAGAAGTSGQSDTVRILSPCLDADCDAVEAADKVCHLVQDEDLIARIHNEELPPRVIFGRNRCAVRL